jgi:hypothetical protein
MSRTEKPLFSSPLDGIEGLVRQSARVQALATLVRRELPERLAEHIIGVSRRDEDLVVIVDSAAWSARIRYAGPELKARLGELGEPVAGKVRVRVRRPAGTQPAG